MPFMEEEAFDRYFDVDTMEKAEHVILTRSDKDDSCCMVVASRWDNDYEPDDDWYDSQGEDLWDLYQDVDIQWAYRDISTVQSNRPNRMSRTATVLLSR